MSRNFEFSAYLNTNYCQANILLILENCSKLGCIFSDRLYNLVDANLATTTLWEQYSQETLPLIRVEYKKNYFNIWFCNKNDKIYLYLGPTHIGWKKRYDLCNSYGINFYRYQNFMLRLIGNTEITHFETYEYFNASYEAEDMSHNKKIYVKLYMYWPYDVYHHLKVNGKMLGITWLDANRQPIDLKVKDNELENMLNDEQNEQCWYGLDNNIVLKFSLIAGPIFIVEPMSNGISAIDQAELLDRGLRITIELFRNLHVFRLITFKSEEDIININKMDD